jgi:hypothetical protein
MDLDSFLVSLYVFAEDWWKAAHCPDNSTAGRPSLISDPEILTLAILAQWPRFRSERDFWRFASAHLRGYFPTLPSQSQFNRRVRALEGEMRSFQLHLAAQMTEKTSAVYHVLDTTLVPAVVRVRACRKGLFAGQATFGRCASKTEWIYGFKVGLAITPEGVITVFCLAEACADERPIGDLLIREDSHEAYLADKGFSSVGWERRWLQEYGALVAATPKDNSRRAWPEAARRWACGKRQIVEGVINQLKDQFFLECHRAKTLEGLLARLSAKIAAYTCGQRLNRELGRPLRHLADLLT